MTSITYTIDVPEEQVETFQQFLKERDIPFDPRKNVMAQNDAFRADSTAFGQEAGELIQTINAYLEEQDIPERVRTDHQEWLPVQLQRFLQFAVDNFNWCDGKIEYAWWDGSEEEWQTLVEQHEWLFQGESLPES